MDAKTFAEYGAAFDVAMEMKPGRRLSRRRVTGVFDPETARAHARETMARPAPEPNQVAIALALLKGNRGNLRRTSRQLKIPRNTLRYWRDVLAHDPEIALLTPLACEVLADKLEEVVWMCLDRMQWWLTEHPDELTLIDLAYALGVVCDALVGEWRLQRAQLHASAYGTTVPSYVARA